MLGKRITGIGFSLVVLAAVLGTAVCQAVPGIATCDALVVPARHTIIQLGFDIAALRDVALVAYDHVEDSDVPLLHTWNASAHAWRQISIGEYNVGTFCDGSVNEMILVGTSEDLPAALIGGASQAEKVTRIDTLFLADVVNTLDKSMKFSKGEWKVLARRHALQIKDLNEERRRWGRYGPRDGERAEVQQTSEVEVLDPEALVEANIRAATAEEATLDLRPETENRDDVEPAPVQAAEIAAPEVEAVEVVPEAVEAAPAVVVDEKGSQPSVQTMEAEDGAIESALDTVDRVIESAEDK
ncbi:MAG: hypothetical protein HN341_06960 [Verrucomicrobia bacterium]|jgi:hypothetical protein|nr:hypothetical protein [Verrucomicrobiota bacterium]